MIAERRRRVAMVECVFVDERIDFVSRDPWLHMGPNMIHHTGVELPRCAQSLLIFLGKIERRFLTQGHTSLVEWVETIQENELRLPNVLSHSARISLDLKGSDFGSENFSVVSLSDRPACSTMTGSPN